MTKILFALLAILLNSVVSFSQNAHERIEITKHNLELMDSVDNNILNRRIEGTELIFPKFMAPIEGMSFFNIHTNTANTFPFKSLTFHGEFNYFLQPEAIRNQPSLHDFSGSRSDRIFNGLHLISGSNKNTFLSYGEYFQVNETLQWAPTNEYRFDVGGFFCRQYDFFSGSRSDIVGVNTQTSYSLGSKVQFKIWGQYVSPLNQNLFKGNPFFPNSNIGSSFLFNLKNKTKVDVGVRYRYYENKMNWNIESVSKISIGF